jgi:phage-related protein
MPDLKPVMFRGSALDDLRAFPAVARREAGHQIDQVQRGRDLDDWKPMNTVGPGVREIRIRDAAVRSGSSTQRSLPMPFTCCTAF